MIIRTFRKSYLMQYLYLLLLHLILWGGAFLSPSNYVYTENSFLSPVYAFLINLIGDHQYLSVALAFFLVLAGSLIFNYTLEKNELSGVNSLIPAMTFIVMLSLVPSLQTFHPALIPGILMIFVLNNLFDIYTQEEAYLKVFNSGLLIAISSFFYFPSIVFILFVWLTFIEYRLYNWREWVILLFGFITPYLLLWTYFFWMDELTQAFQAYGEYFTPKSIIKFRFTYTLLNYFSVALVVILFIRAFFVQTFRLNETIISIRKRFWAVILFLFVSLVSFMVSGNMAESHIVFIQISFALIIQGLLFKLNKYFWTELLLGILIAMLLINNYFMANQII